MVALRQPRHHGSLHNGEPMNTITLTEVLEYYDGIQMFAARDTTGVHYVCDMIESAGDFDRYAVAAVCPKRLNDFRTGQVDLRTLLLEVWPESHQPARTVGQHFPHHPVDLGPGDPGHLFPPNPAADSGERLQPAGTGPHGDATQPRCGAGFCATQSRRIPVCYSMIVHVIRCNTHYLIDNRR